MSKSRKRPSVVVTGPASRLPSQRGLFGNTAPVEPISALPREKPGERINSAESVQVTNPKAQQPREKRLPGGLS